MNKNRITTFLISIIMIFWVCIYPTCTIAANQDIKVYVDGTQVGFDVPPQIINDRTMVPLRAIFEALGAEVYWYDDIKAIEAYLGNTKLVLYVGSEEMYKNGQIVILDSPPVITNGRTLVPVRAIAEGFDCQVNWDNTTRTVYIENKYASDRNVSFYEAAEIYGVTVDELKNTLGITDDIDYNTPYDDVIANVTLSAYIGDEYLEEFKAEYNLGDDVTGQTLWGEIREKVEEKQRLERVVE